MITSFDIYLITRLDYLGDFLFGSLILSLIFLITFVVAMANCFSEKPKEGSHKYEERILVYNDDLSKFKKYFVRSLIVVIIVALLNILIPSTKEAVAIWAIPKIANNEMVQQIPENFAKLINSKLQEWMKDVGIEENKSIDKSE